MKILTVKICLSSSGGEIAAEYEVFRQALDRCFNYETKKMKGIILAGGTATRLFPLTATTSKQLLPVYDRQMIFYPLNVLIKAGIGEILIIVAPDNSGQFLNLLGSIFQKHDIKVEFMVQKIPKGLADAFIIGEDFIDDDDVMLILGDNIFEDDLYEKIGSFKKGGMIFVKKVPDPKRYGVVEFDKNLRAISIEEKPKKPKSNYCVTGAYVYDSRVVEIAKNLKSSDRGEIEITDINNEYLKTGNLAVKKLKGAWLDAGTFDSLLEAGNIVKDRKMYKKFDPIIGNAIKELNAELKNIAKNALFRGQNKNTYTINI
ncbi:MAG: sugar phosphate nucleotidyltransferase [Patescibacteria group bacterium]|nr:sugar phosphate nucleotidyltransferase [Patescibacteria group bacterium]